MFYVSNKYDNNIFGITDSKDDIEETYTVPEIIEFMNVYKQKISGVSLRNGKVNVKVVRYNDIVPIELRSIYLEIENNGDMKASFEVRLKEEKDYDNVEEYLSYNYDEGISFSYCDFMNMRIKLGKVPKFNNLFSFIKFLKNEYKQFKFSKNFVLYIEDYNNFLRNDYYKEHKRLIEKLQSKQCANGVFKYCIFYRVKKLKPIEGSSGELGLTGLLGYDFNDGFEPEFENVKKKCMSSDMLNDLNRIIEEYHY